jgi:hypothetical protein
MIIGEQITWGATNIVTRSFVKMTKFIHSIGGEAHNTVEDPGNIQADLGVHVPVVVVQFYGDFYK